MVQTSANASVVSTQKLFNDDPNVVNIILDPKFVTRSIAVAVSVARPLRHIFYTNKYKGLCT